MRYDDPLHAANHVPADAGKLLIGFAFIPEDQPEVRMDQVVDWQSPYFPRIFETYDRADFAQEFLRRSPAYRRAYRSAALAPTRRRTARLAGLARRWGLVFRPRP
ncbi:MULTISPECIES: transcriptional regulator domain-containing protein [unclassified Sphingopyxis]|uniref:transcriptional regulator domain-containing protein n=2 Tax=Sphingomonadaceae TaxID=41297 RepID=UPI000A92EC8C